MSYEKFFDQLDDGVDPRVQVELERLNSSTDEINKLEVDLDEARNQFRQLLQESTSQIDSFAKKLGNCIVKVRPYYDARIQAKEALQETQKAAVNFERANSAHAAAKEMVYLAEEGLKAEGRTFDHAWQEMLNHATMRVNESEAERTRCEAEHKRTSQYYQLSEMRVRTLQKELKRAITKSRPYFELKIYYNQLLEKQKKKVKSLEKQVADVKLTYAHTLKNLEQISDEIHKTRQRNKSGTKMELAKLQQNGESESELPKEMNHTNSTPGCAKTTSFHKDLKMGNNNNNKVVDVQFESDTGNNFWISDTNKILSPISETHSSTCTQTSNTTVSSQPDTDNWSEYTDENFQASPNSENDSSMTGPPDTESEEETFKFSEKLDSIRPQDYMGSVPNNLGAGDVKIEHDLVEQQLLTTSNTINGSSGENHEFFEGVGICSFPIETELNLNFGEKENKDGKMKKSSSNWTEIKLRSPEEEIFSTVKHVSGKYKNELEEDFDIPYAPLPEAEGDYTSQNELEQEKPIVIVKKGHENEITCDLTNGKSRKEDVADNENLSSRSLKGTPKKLNLRRQSLDVLWNSTASEKVKEIFSQSIMKLNISSLTERKSSDSKIGEGKEFSENENSTNTDKEIDSSYESNLTNQFGIHFFNRRNSKLEDDIQATSDDKKSQIGGFMSRKERFFTKKVASPLEKTMNYINADEESNSDNESLACSDMLTDEQLSSLVLDRDLTEIYQDLI